MATDRRAAKRSRASAKKAGADFEIRQGEYLSVALENPYISRQDKNGSSDLGDLAFVGYRAAGLKGLSEWSVPITLECKNTATMNLASAVREAHTEAGNYRAKHGGPAPLPILMHKRHGVADPGRQWVTMEADTFVRLLRIAEGAEQ